MGFSLSKLNTKVRENIFVVFLVSAWSYFERLFSVICPVIVFFRKRVSYWWIANIVISYHIACNEIANEPFDFLQWWIELRIDNSIVKFVACRKFEFPEAALREFEFVLPQPQGHWLLLCLSAIRFQATQCRENFDFFEWHLF